MADTPSSGESMSYGVGKRDNAEDAICGALTKAGCDIVYANRKPWDVIVGRAGVTYLLEIKTGSAPLTEAQIEFQKAWRGQYTVVRSAEEALKAVGVLR
jgi:hypothetical protein